MEVTCIMVLYRLNNGQSREIEVSSLRGWEYVQADTGMVIGKSRGYWRFTVRL